MRWTLMLAGAAALALGGGAAQAQSADTLQVFTRADFERALVDAGATITSTDRTDPRIDFTFEGEVQADGLLLACEEDATLKNCYGSSILATFTADDGTTDEQIKDAINTYNYNENFGRAYVDPDGVISVRMYIISDGGITRENYSRQIGLWFASVVDFFGYLYPESGE
ncbi:MAG: YbjN domain-containing protein [Erythrobacter sp.]|nr:YbjN domain-containing protein [Erythrobacter sp.]